MTALVVGGFEVSQQLGEGAFSKVYLGVRRDRKAASSAKLNQVAIKLVAVPANTDSDDYRKKVIKEVRLHKVASAQHINVLKLLDWAEQKDGAIFIILEYAHGGDLFDKIAPDVGISEELAHLYFTQLLAALTACHASGIVHRDIKPENMLLDQQGNLKLADFGLAELFRYQGKEKKCTEACGSAPYAAPELASGIPYRAQPVDIWSAGVVLFTLLVGNTPWDQPTISSDEYQQYLSGDLLQQDPWTRIPQELMNLLLAILHPDPKRRAKTADIHKYPWYQITNPYLKDGQVNDSSGVWDALYSTLNANGEFDIKSAWSSDGSTDEPAQYQASQGMYSPGQASAILSASMPRSQGRERDVFRDITNRAGNDQSVNTKRKEKSGDDIPKTTQLHRRIVEASMRAANEGTGPMASATQYSQCLSMAPSQMANPNNSRFWSDQSLETIVTELLKALHHLGVKCEAFATSDGAEVAWASRDKRSQVIQGAFKVKYEPTDEDYEHADQNMPLSDMVAQAHEARQIHEAEQAAMKQAALRDFAMYSDDLTIQPGQLVAHPIIERRGRGYGGHSVALQGQGDPLERKRLMANVEKLLPAHIVRAR